jgi:hypothetical protein
MITRAFVPLARAKSPSRHRPRSSRWSRSSGMRTACGRCGMTPNASLPATLPKPSTPALELNGYAEIPAMESTNDRSDQA